MTSYAYTLETLDNGLRVFHLDLPHVHSTGLAAYVAAGPVYEGESNHGVSHMAEHLHCAVTPQHRARSDLMHAIHDLAGDFDASTDADSIRFQITVAPPLLGEAGELLSQILAITDYPKEIIEAERRLLMTETGDPMLSEEFKGYRALLFGRHPFGRSFGGTPRSFGRLSIEAITDFNSQAFAPDRISVAVVGRIDAGMLRRACDALARLRSVRAERLTPPDPPQIVLPRISRLPTTQAIRHIAMGFWVPGLRDTAHKIRLNMLTSGLQLPSSPLFETLRYSAGSAYVFGSHQVGILDDVLFFFYGNVRRQERASFVQNVLDEIVNICEQRQAPPWFEHTRRYYQHFIECSQDVPATLAGRIAGAEVHADGGGTVTIEDELNVIRETTWSDFSAAVRSAFRGDRFFLFFDSRFRSNPDGIKKVARSTIARLS